MKNIRQFCAAVALACVFTLSTFAGQMETGITEPPPPASTTDGQMETGIAGQITTGSSEAVDPVTEIALSLLQNLLPLF
jgi:hypothetical protein